MHDSGLIQYNVRFRGQNENLLVNKAHPSIYLSIYLSPNFYLFIYLFIYLFYFMYILLRKTMFDLRADFIIWIKTMFTFITMKNEICFFFSLFLFISFYLFSFLCLSLIFLSFTIFYLHYLSLSLFPSYQNQNRITTILFYPIQQRVSNPTGKYCYRFFLFACIFKLN